MSNIIPFDFNNVPSYLKTSNVNDLNGDLLSHAGGGFPVISIKGKAFAVVRDGERTMIMNPKDPDSPATSIEMVLVKANKGTSKVWYANGYVEGGEAKKPDCFSNDGIRPDPSSEQKQSNACATCPQNQWGARITPAGKKGKACSDSVRIAVATVDAINDPYMIRVPPASIRNLGEYGKMLAKKGVGYNMVVTKIGFNPESPTPELTFKPIGFVPDDLYPEVVECAASDVVQNILGGAAIAPAVADERFEQVAAPKVAEAPKVATKEKKVQESEVIAAVSEAVEPKKKAAAPAAQAVDVAEIDLDSLGFDD